MVAGVDVVGGGCELVVVSGTVELGCCAVVACGAAVVVVLAALW